MIRDMKKEDIPEVSLLEEKIFSAPWSEKSFADALESPHNIYLVEERESRVAGYCGIWTSFEDSDLCNIAVSPEFRRKNIGESLLLEGIQRVKSMGVERILLEVRKTNEAAIGLYQKNGFRTIGVRKAYYTKPVEDAVLMELSI